VLLGVIICCYVLLGVFELIRYD